MFNFPENIVTTTANWVRVPNSIPFKLRGIPYENFGLNSFQLRKKRTARILVTTSTLFNTLNNCCCREFVCLTENCWSSLILAILDIGNGYYWQWTLKKYGWCMVIKHYSQVPDRSLFQSSLSDTVPEFLITYCSRHTDVKHWAKMPMLDTWLITTTQPCFAKRCSR